VRGKQPINKSGQSNNAISSGLNAQKKPNSTRKVLIIIAAALVLILVGGAAVVFAFFNQVKETQRVLLDDVSFEEQYEISDVFPEHIVNIGLMGFDRGWNREELGENLFRPDMLAVMSINFDTDQIAVVRIPRDSYVPLYGTGGFHDKINHSFYAGYKRGGDDPEAEGILTTLRTVSNVLGGIPIHYYISVDMYSIIELVDAMGGIYYEVEETIYDKHWNVGEVLVPEGPQMMDGKTYLRYLQYRDDKSNQDYGRIDRQMKLLKQTYLYLRENGKITDIPTTYRIYKDYVETDLTYKQIAALAYYARDFEVTDESLRFYTMPGEGQMMDGIWYQVIFQSDRVRIIKEVFGIEADPWPPIVLKDSQEYLEEQERQRLEEEGLLFDDQNDDEGEGEDEEGRPESGSEMINPVFIPDLTGMNLDEARAALESAGLALGDILERHYTFMESGRVVFSEPLPGLAVAPGTAVNLILSLGAEPPAE
jgi:polyisoprenyl-teichoic acid--peptidoglycan teichoic acid transferase